MIRGLFLSASGMLSNMQRQEVVTNNLANASTYGFRRSVAVEKANESALFRRYNDTFMVTPAGWDDTAPVIGHVGRGVVMDETVLDLTQGQTVETGHDWDLLIRGGGFFAIQTPEHGVALTRHGGFSQDETGRLVTRDGLAVLGINGEILLPHGAQISVAEDGVISVDGLEQDQLLIVRPADSKQLRPLGHNLLLTPGNNIAQVGDGEVSIRQGSLESSNVSVIREMVTMIQLHRAYEANQRMIQYQDEILEKAVTELPTVR